MKNTRDTPYCNAVHVTGHSVPCDLFLHHPSQPHVHYGPNLVPVAVWRRRIPTRVLCWTGRGCWAIVMAFGRGTATYYQAELIANAMDQRSHYSGNIDHPGAYVRANAYQDWHNDPRHDRPDSDELMDRAIALVLLDDATGNHWQQCIPGNGETWTLDDCASLMALAVDRWGYVLVESELRKVMDRAMRKRMTP